MGSLRTCGSGRAGCAGGAPDSVCGGPPLPFAGPLLVRRRRRLRVPAGRSAWAAGWGGGAG